MDKRNYRNEIKKKNFNGSKPLTKSFITSKIYDKVKNYCSHRIFYRTKLLRFYYNPYHRKAEVYQSTFPPAPLNLPYNHNQDLL